MTGFDPFPQIETENLILRRMLPADLEDLFEMRNNPDMGEFTDTKPDEDIEETKAYMDKMNRGIDDNKWIIWAIEYKQAKKVIGTISIWNINIEDRTAELGYGLLPEYQERGLMKEALLEAVGYGFGVMRLRTMEAYTEEANLRSSYLLQRCGFIPVDRVDDQGYINDRVYHMVVYRLEKQY